MVCGFGQAYRIIPLDMNFNQRKHSSPKPNHTFAGTLFIQDVEMVVKEISSIILHCDDMPFEGHASGDKTVTKIL